MANGVDVWFDEWEIEPGDSLRQKMEEGLGSMTHFVVVLTETSIAKPWVAKEIDVGLVQQVGGKSRFVPLVVDLDPAKLSPFLQAMLFLKIDPASQVDLKGWWTACTALAASRRSAPRPMSRRRRAGWRAGRRRRWRSASMSSRPARMRWPSTPGDPRGPHGRARHRGG
jgi:hypothetical protein